MRNLAMAAFASALLAVAAASANEDERFVFRSIDGGLIDLRDYRGGPVLIVNTASRCGFTSQYDGLQALWDEYRGEGLTVLGVPSDSFRQELESDAAVKDFCDVNFSIDFPMTTVSDVTGADAHPFYRWLAAQGVTPGWNFHKVLLDADGGVAASFTTAVTPRDAEVIRAIARELPAS